MADPRDPFGGHLEAGRGGGRRGEIGRRVVPVSIVGSKHPTREAHIGGSAEPNGGLRRSLGDDRRSCSMGIDKLDGGRGPDDR